jgi:hypothetical protein
MQLMFSCPECSSGAIIELSEDEVEKIKNSIINDGRSPTLLSRCENDHELIVTLYFRDDELGVRDIAVPLEANGKKEKPKELDWVRSAFGGK